MGYRAVENVIDLRDEVDFLNGKIKKLKSENRKLLDCVKDFRDYGTRHDINPTGVFKTCGCFDSFKGDYWQGYIKSQDKSVRDRAIAVLKELEE